MDVSKLFLGVSEKFMDESGHIEVVDEEIFLAWRNILPNINLMNFLFFLLIALFLLLFLRALWRKMRKGGLI